MYKFKNKKGFTLIELVVVMSVIGILVLLAMPKFMGYTKRAQLTEIKSNIKQLENASERYYINKQEWPKLSDTPYTAEEIESFAKEIKNKTGSIVTLDADGSYYEIDYNKLHKYVQKPKDDIHYILQNPIGEVFYLEDLTAQGKDSLYNPQKEEVIEEVVDSNHNIVGNTYGNLNNFNNGRYITHNGWLYYANDKDKGNLYKLSNDKTQNIKISLLNGISPRYMNIIGDDIYYKKTGAPIGIGKYNITNNTNVLITSQDSYYINVLGDWVYYSANSYRIHKVKTDGSNQTQINNMQSLYLNVQGDWIYYVGDKSNLYKIKTDGTNLTKLNDCSVDNMVLNKNWIYYTDNNTNDNIYKIDINGASNEKISSDNAQYLNIYKDKIYYLNNSDNKYLYTMNLDGSNKQKLLSVKASYLNIVDDWIYYQDFDKSYAQYKVKIDGTQLQPLS